MVGNALLMKGLEDSYLILRDKHNIYTKKWMPRDGATLAIITYASHSPIMPTKHPFHREKNPSFRTTFLIPRATPETPP